MPTSFSDPHPTPPHDERDRLDRLRLLRSHRVGPATYHRLLAAHGTAAAALAALPGMARGAGLSGYAPCPEARARAEIRAAREAGARAVFDHEPAYPPALREVEGAPAMLWARGDLALAHRPAVAIVGARDASSLGQRMARALARGLSEAGHVVVSGLARGIDAVAHEAAVGRGTIAVTAGGCDVAYPPQNADLMARIASAGLILSAQPMGLGPQARHFPRRNHVVSGLAQAVVVVEAAARSGTLITARAALDQGREVLAVPGHPFDGRASGCNALIRDGAVLVRGVDDVLEALAAATGRSVATGRSDAGGRGGAWKQDDDAERDDGERDAAPRRAGRRGPGPVAGRDAATGRADARARDAAGDPNPVAGRSDAGQRGPAGAAEGRRAKQDAAAERGATAARTGPPLRAGAAGRGRGETSGMANDAPVDGHAIPSARGAPPDGPAPPDGGGPPAGGGEALRSGILSLLGPSPVAEDQVIRDSGAPAERVLPEILTLELEGRIERHPGGLLTRAA